MGDTDAPTVWSVLGAHNGSLSLDDVQTGDIRQLERGGG